MIAEYRKNHKDKQRPHNTRPDDKAHLGTGDAEQAEIPKPAAADHEPVVTALSEPDQLFLRVDIVCHENGNDCRYQPINEETSGIEVLDAGQINHLHIFTLPFKYNCFTNLYIIPQGTV